MYDHKNFIKTFLEEAVSTVGYDAENWIERVKSCSDKFNPAFKHFDFVCGELYCIVINDLDEMEFPLTDKEVQKLEGLACIIPLIVPVKCAERKHLLHYVLFQEYNKRKDPK